MRPLTTPSLFAGLAFVAALAAGPGALARTHPDLANAVAGSYHGDVISDSQGSSHDNVTLTITRTGPNEVSISSDYPRLPVITVRLESAMGHVVNRGGTSPFAYDHGKLDVSFENQVSWSGHQ
jgi:hypothetical protein